MVDVEALLERADLLLAQGRAADAEKQLAEVLRQEPENAQALALLARCKYERRLFREGIELVHRAIRIAPYEAYYFYLLAFGHYQADENGPAQQFIRKAIELNPYAADFFGLWSLLLIEIRDFHKALEKANEGLEVDPENITCLNARSTALNKLKRVDDAIETMQSALEQDPENHYTHTTVGWNYLEKGRHREAADHFREALRLEPNLENARVGLKQALKSKITPYRWLLQYSFWINNKGKSARWVIPLAIYFGVQLIAKLSKSAGSEWTYVGVAVIALYLLFAATSWIINPLANFFLLFHKDGKYALTDSERWNAWLTVSALLAGAVVALTGWGINHENLLMGGLVILSLALPLGHMDFPIRFSNNHRAQWFSIALLTLGIVTIATVLAGFPDQILMIYMIAFIAYTWVSALSSR